MVCFPILAGEIAKQGIKKKDVAECIGVCGKSLHNKMSGKVPFTWPEVKAIRHRFFPDIDPEYLFQREPDAKNAQDSTKNSA